MKRTICFGIILLYLGFACKSGGDKGNQGKEENKDTLKKISKGDAIGILAPPDSNYTGDFFEKYSNGIIKVKGFFRFGKKAGKWIYFYPNGLAWSEAFFDNDKMHGESIVYHENGAIKYQGRYNQNTPIGRWTFYDSTGKVANVKVYDSIPSEKK